MNKKYLFECAKKTLKIEITEAQRMLDRLDESIVYACRILMRCKGKVIVSGIGKSGHIGKKIAASLASTGTPAFFVHAAEALHGDLGMIEADDVVIFISYSGRIRELNILIPFLKDKNIPLIALTGNLSSPLAQEAISVLDIRVEKEACPIGLTPTSSIVNALMMGDALTIMLMRQRKFSVEQFALSHPGGNIGTQLLNRVHHIMRKDKQIPKVNTEDTVMDAMFELSRTGLGLTAICDSCGKVIGVFTDGDLRRWLVKGCSLTDSIIKAMIHPGYQLPKDWYVTTAIDAMHRQQITAAPVVNNDGILVGAINLHDLHQTGID